MAPPPLSRLSTLMACLRRLGRRVLLNLLLLIAVVWALEHYHWLPRGTLKRGLILVTELLIPDFQADEPWRRPRRLEAGSIDWAEVQAQLDALPIRAETARGYAREDWPHWLDRNGNCRTTRTEVLIRDSLEPPRLTRDGCQVTFGRWRDAYTGEEYRKPADLDIDHRVPLEEVHDSGGARWSRERRAAYANDLTDPNTLVVVSATANRSKGARGPEDWLPPDDGAVCPYIAAWVEVKHHWSLSQDPRERDAVGTLLRKCRSAKP